jgi:hypothetical protein
LLTIILVLLVAIAAPHEGIRAVAPGMLSAMMVAGFVDALIIRARGREWEFPSGAVWAHAKLPGATPSMSANPAVPSACAQRLLSNSPDASELGATLFS